VSLEKANGVSGNGAEEWGERSGKTRIRKIKEYEKTRKKGGKRRLKEVAIQSL
jgi:hypothetical protein